MSEKRNTFFGAEIDSLARRIGQWPAEPIVFKLECLNDQQVLFTGAAPNGRHRRDGRPMIDRKAGEYRAVCSIGQYRDAIGVAS